MPKVFVSFLVSVLIFTASAALAQKVESGGQISAAPATEFSTKPLIDVSIPSTPLPRMAPELALQMFTQRTLAQSEKLAATTDTTVVEAELPDSSQKGEYELIRSYTAPHSLNFATIKFTGDNFVKTNVIVRLLQQEVEHVEKGDGATSAITDQNYKFNYKGMENVDGKLCHVFQLKPRQKRPGLFKGKIYVDVYSASLRRAEGTLVKSPSFFVKNIDFVQDFVDVAGYTLPAKMRSTAKARIIGRAVVNVFHREYKLEAKAAVPVAPPVSGADSQAGISH